MSPFPYYICYSMPVLFFLGLHQGGWGLLFLPVFSFIIVPVLDFFSGVDTSNPSEEQEQEMKNKSSFRMATLRWVPVQFAIVVYTAWFIGHSTFSVVEYILLIINAGLLSGALGITIAHELCHRQTKWEQLASQGILLCLSYMHFYIEHVVGHHQRVSTPEDPTSAEKGLNLYKFLVRSIVGSYKSAWGFEAKRVRIRKLKFWTLPNRMINYLLIQISFTVAIYLLFGWAGLAFFIGQCIVGVVLLETVNYVEHYGLTRKKLDNGRYEKVTPHHSWNASQKISNYFLFKLQRHSDHHANPLRRYQILKHYPESPQLPFGYPSMVLIALIPPLWMKLMDPRVDNYYV